jgi:hypothetical protein
MIYFRTVGFEIHFYSKKLYMSIIVVIYTYGLITKVNKYGNVWND